MTGGNLAAIAAGVLSGLLLAQVLIRAARRAR